MVTCFALIAALMITADIYLCQCTYIQGWLACTAALVFAMRRVAVDYEKHKDTTYR